MTSTTQFASERSPRSSPQLIIKSDQHLRQVASSFRKEKEDGQPAAQTRRLRERENFSSTYTRVLSPSGRPSATAAPPAPMAASSRHIECNASQDHLGPRMQYKDQSEVVNGKSSKLASSKSNYELAATWNRKARSPSPTCDAHPLWMTDAGMQQAGGPDAAGVDRRNRGREQFGWTRKAMSPSPSTTLTTAAAVPIGHSRRPFPERLDTSRLQFTSPAARDKAGLAPIAQDGGTYTQLRTFKQTEAPRQAPTAQVFHSFFS